ncbi:MAG: flavin reductase [Roseomonas sp.]|jgi:flavin reductase|nr:flavin reductase [Roseomonas sp.]
MPGADPAAFREGMRAMPGAVAIIATGHAGERTGMTATAVCSLSDSPPMLLVCVNAAASAHPVIREHGHFAVNLLAEGQDEIAARFAGRGGLKGEARFGLGDWATLETGAPVLRDAMVSFDCALVAEHVHTTHSIFVGAVQGIASRPGAPPLLYLAGEFGGFRASN